MLKNEIDENVISKLDISLAVELNHFLSTKFPWSGTHIDWGKLEHKRIDWNFDSDSKEQIKVFIQQSFWKECFYIAVLYTTKRPLSIFTRDFVSHNLDSVIGNFQQCFLFGITETKGQWQINRDYFIEVEFGENLWSWQSGNKYI
ncbi:MAG TPA: hypothetical protein VF540_11375 [Segetibacter sp.]|jgi:hypothetical protein